MIPTTVTTIGDNQGVVFFWMSGMDAHEAAVSPFDCVAILHGDNNSNGDGNRCVCGAVGCVKGSGGNLQACSASSIILCLPLRYQTLATSTNSGETLIKIVTATTITHFPTTNKRLLLSFVAIKSL